MTNEVICPDCKNVLKCAEIVAYDNHYFEETVQDECECKCRNCGKIFDVIFTYTLTKIEYKE